MRTLVTVGALALFGLVQPAAAQMCGGPQQAQASMPAQGGMMCGGTKQQAQDDPMADKPAPKPQASGMCPCCRNMAMMRGGMQHDMPGMPGMAPPAPPPPATPQ